MKRPTASRSRASSGAHGFDALSSETFSARSAAPSAAVWLALRRARGGWRFLLAVAADLLLVVTLLCAIPLSTTLLTAIELQSQLAAQPVGGRNIDVAITHTHLPSALQADENQIVATQGRTSLSSFAPQAPTNFIVSSSVALLSQNGAAPENYTRLTFEAYQNSQILPHIHLLAGAPLPTAEAASATPGVLITQQMAQTDSVRVGDLLTVGSPFQFGRVGLTVRVAGIWAPTNPADPFWNGATFASLPLFDSDPFIFPALISPTALAPALDPLNVIFVQHWIFSTDTQAITPARMSAISADLTRFRSDLATALLRKNYVVGIQTITGLDKLLASVSQQQARFALSVDSVGILALGAALLLLALVAHLFIDRDRAVIAIVRSRGASAGQILGAYVSLTTLVGALATVLGAALAVWLTPQIVQRYISPAALRGAVVSSAYLARQIELGQIALYALMCLVVSSGITWWATVSTLRTDTRALALESASGGAKPFWQRLYLDVFLAALCAVGYLDLTYYGATPSNAAASPSPLLAATPLLLLVAGSLLLLRLFPVVAALWARAAARGRGALGLLTSVQLTRGGARAALQALLPMLAVAVLALVVTYDATVRQSAAAQSAYAAGADIRLIERTSESPAADTRIRAQLAQGPDAPAVSPVYRGTVHTAVFWNVSGGQNDTVDALAIDPRTWASTTADGAWRASYASAPLSTLMAQMVAHEPPSADKLANVGAQSNPLWVLVSRGFAQTQGLKVGDEFRLILPDSSSQFSYFVVGAVVNDFPTLYPARTSGGFIIADERSFFAAMSAQSAASSSAIGPNEYWLHAHNSSATLAAVQRQQDQLDASALVVRQSLEADMLGAPSLVGMRALLIFGAIAIGLLTLLAAALQTTLNTQQRRPQLMTLRAIGVSRTQLASVLIGERVFAVLFGALGGGLTGWALSRAILPYLQVGEAAGGGAATPALVTNPTLLALAVGALVGLLLLESVVVSVRAARSAINLRLLSVDS